MSKQFYFKQFSLAYVRSLVHLTLPDATTSGKSRPGTDGNEWVLRIPQSSSITRASLSDSLVSYQDTRCVCVAVLPLCREADGIYCNPSRLDRPLTVTLFQVIRKNMTLILILERV